MPMYAHTEPVGQAVRAHAEIDRLSGQRGGDVTACAVT